MIVVSADLQISTNHNHSYWAKSVGAWFVIFDFVISFFIICCPLFCRFWLVIFFIVIGVVNPFHKHFAVEYFAGKCFLPSGARNFSWVVALTSQRIG